MKLITEPSRPTITIELTPKDQDALYTVGQFIGGPDDGPRGTFTALNEILYKLGARDVPVDRTSTGSIYFK